MALQPAPKTALAPGIFTAPSPNQAAAQTAAKTQSSLDQYMSYLKTNMGRVDPAQIEQEAQSYVNASVSPLIKGYQAQATAGNNQIAGLTATYAQQLGNIGNQASQAYTTAEGQQSALDTAEAQALQGNLTSGLSAFTNAGIDSSVVSQAASDAASAAGAQYVSGSAGLSALFAQGAAQNAYNKTLPGLASLAGLQATGTYDAGLSAAEASAVNDAQAKVPGLIASLTSDALKQQSNTLEAGKDIFNAGVTQQNADTATARAQTSAAAEAFKEGQPKTYGNASTGYFALVPDGKGGYTNTQLTQPGAKAPKTFGSAASGYYSIDPSTGAVTQLTSAAPKKTSVKLVGSASTGYTEVDPTTGKVVGKIAAGGSFSQSTLNAAASLVDKASKGTTPHYYEGKPVKGSGSGAAPYSSVVQQVIASGPSTAAWKAKAAQIVNANPAYAPGLNGRAYQSISQALPSIQQNVTASIANGHTAVDTYKSAVASGAYPAKMRKQLVYEINKIYTQDYFQKNPGATSLPAGVLIGTG